MAKITTTRVNFLQLLVGTLLHLLSERGDSVVSSNVTITITM